MMYLPSREVNWEGYHKVGPAWHNRIIRIHPWLVTDGCSASRGGHAPHIWTLYIWRLGRLMRVLYTSSLDHHFHYPPPFVDHPPMIGAIFHDHLSLWLPFSHMATHVFSVSANFMNLSYLLCKLPCQHAFTSCSWKSMFWLDATSSGIWLLNCLSRFHFCLFKSPSATHRRVLRLGYDPYWGCLAASWQNSSTALLEIWFSWDWGTISTALHLSSRFFIPTRALLNASIRPFTSPNRIPVRVLWLSWCILPFRFWPTNSLCHTHTA